MRPLGVMLLSLAGLASAGCLATPSPLAPSVRGSVGVPQYGVQTDARELPIRGPGFRRLRPRSPNYWGNPRLVRALEVASARTLERHPGGAPLVIGDISSRTGGKIPRHRSHRTGRDVDLLWYVTTPGGAPVPSPGFVHVASDGLALVPGDADRRYVRLDVERNWTLVKELIGSEHIGVQWMFVSRDVEALLIDYARARDEDPELIWHAETVLLEPKDSTPHDDHMHLRIACTPEEMSAGCAGGGPYWEWLPALAPPGWLGADEQRAIAKEDPFELERTAGSAAGEPDA